MTKNSIELTLQQLIDIGVIKLKNKKRRKKRAKVSKISNDIFSQNKTPSSHMQGYSTPNYLPMSQQNTDALRLRDDNLNLNTRLMEQRMALENSKQDADEFQNKTRAAFMHVFNNMASAPTLGYSDYDADGAFSGNGGSDYFRSMNDIRPDTAVRMPDAGPVIDEIDEDANSAITIDKKDAFYPKAAQEQSIETPTKSASFIGRLSKGIFSGGGSSSTKKMAAGRAAYQSFDKIDDSIFGDASHVDSAAEYEAEPARPPVAKEAALPEINSGDFQNVRKSKNKPTSEEIRQWKQFYVTLAGDAPDPTILESNRRPEIEKAISKILIAQYKELGGDNRQVLKSTDSKQIGREVERLKRLKQILA